MRHIMELLGAAEQANAAKASFDSTVTAAEPCNQPQQKSPESVWLPNRNMFFEV